MVTSNFTLALRSGADIEGWPCVDIFTLKQDGEELCDIHFAWSDENEDQSCKIVAIKKGFHAADLPFVNQPFMLVGIVQTIIDRALLETGHEFYACAFYSDEDCEIERELPIDFAEFKDR